MDDDMDNLKAVVGTNAWGKPAYQKALRGSQVDECRRAKAILFAAGTVQQAESILPDVQKILGDKPLKYIFVSHMESDEAGVIEVFRKSYPEVTVLCGPLLARVLHGSAVMKRLLKLLAGALSSGKFR